MDSKPIEVCRIARAKRCKIGKSHYDKAPAFGYCASQKTYYYGYKLHAICGLNGVIHSFDLTKANVHDIHYLQDIKHEYNNCTLLGDKGYLSAEVQLDLLKQPGLSWKFHIGGTKRTGSRHLSPLLKPEEESKLYSHKCATNL